MESGYYYECHVTLEPINARRLDTLKLLSKKHGFYTSEWFLNKKEKFDFFCTSRGKGFEELQGRMLAFLFELQREGFVVLRYKIEDTLLDSRCDDGLYPLGARRVPSCIQSFDT